MGSEWNLPCEILDVRFLRNEIVLSVKWKFSMPLETGDAGQFVEHRKDQDEFRNELRKQLLHWGGGARLSNLLTAELEKVVLRTLRAHRFGEDVVKRLRTSRERRMAGRPKLQLTSEETERLRQLTCAIYAAIREMRKLIRRWNKRNRPH